MKRITIYLDEALWLAFRKRCLDQHISASKALTELIQHCLDQPQEASDGHSHPRPGTD